MTSITQYRVFRSLALGECALGGLRKASKAA
jgi:hypothetical protein